MRNGIALAIFAAALIAGYLQGCACHHKNAATQPAATAPAISNGSGLRGKVKYEGPPIKPEKLLIPYARNPKNIEVFDERIVVSADGGLANVVVHLVKPIPATSWPAVDASVTVGDFRFMPHVVALQTGGRLFFNNDTGRLTSVHAYSDTENYFNFGMQGLLHREYTMKATERFRVKSDIDRWMSMWVYVFDHPWAVVTDEKGEFSMSGVPDGEYDVAALHETLGSRLGKAIVKDGKGEVGFIFKNGQ